MAGRITILAVLLFTFGSLCYSQEIQRDTIPKYSYSTIPEFWRDMDDLFNDPNFSNAQWGVVIQSLETGEFFYKRNENKLFIPASDL